MNIWIDSLLAVLSVALAIRCLLARRLSECVFLFFSFGLTLAMAWSRLGAVDVAIAEAAIGDGFLGVLLINALRDFSGTPVGFPDVSRKLRDRVGRALMYATLLLGFGVILLYALQAVHEIPPGGGLTRHVKENMAVSGVDHPVTAVLLNFRGYDTWLEVGVVLLALLAIFAAGGRESFRMYERTMQEPVLDPAIRIFTPVLFLVGGFVLYLGKSEPGGAFQAAVLWGASGILLYLGGWPVMCLLPRRAWTAVMAAGFACFLLLGLAFMGAGGRWFEYPVAHAGLLILAVETLAALSIGATLMAIFVFFHETYQSNGSDPDAESAADRPTN